MIDLRNMVTYGNFEWAYSREHNWWEYGWEDPSDLTWHRYFVVYTQQFVEMETGAQVMLLQQVLGLVHDMPSVSPFNSIAVCQRGGSLPDNSPQD